MAGDRKVTSQQIASAIQRAEHTEISEEVRWLREIALQLAKINERDEWNTPGPKISSVPRIDDNRQRTAYDPDGEPLSLRPNRY